MHSYHTLLNLLKEEYEDCQEAHRGHFKTLIEAKAHGITHADWLNLRITWDKHVSALKSVGCFETEYLLTSIGVMNLQPKAFDKWTQFTKEYDEVPSYEVFQQFLNKTCSSVIVLASHNLFMRKLYQVAISYVLRKMCLII